MFVSDNGIELTSNVVLAWCGGDQGRRALHGFGQAACEQQSELSISTGAFYQKLTIIDLWAILIMFQCRYQPVRLKSLY